MSDIAIKVEGLGKRYELGELRSYETIRESLMRLAGRVAKGMVRSRSAQSPESFWALKDVSFEVKRGEVVGIIGRNGAGKSTLLKILSRITEPTVGSAELHGRVGSLLEVGTGFHPELTGRENIYLNGAILGMTRAEIRAKFDEIVAFSEVEKFLDTPVKRYSSGMSVRLAFAVAAHLEPEILIVDEVLAVGDQAFQKKCLGKMSSVAHEGRTVLFVSHNMAAVEGMCDNAIRLEGGCIADAGDVRRVLAGYTDAGTTAEADMDLSAYPGRVRGSRPLLRRFRVLDSSGKTLRCSSTGQDVTFELTVDPLPEARDAAVVLYVVGPHQERILGFFSRYQSAQPMNLVHGAIVTCTMKNSRLMPGRYTITVMVRDGTSTVDEVNDIVFEVGESDIYGTGILPPIRRSGWIAPEASWATC